MELFDAIEEQWVEFVLGGLLLLALAFVLSFCYKTFWGQWKDRAKEKEIYGEPRKRPHLPRGKKRFSADDADRRG